MKTPLTIQKGIPAPTTKYLHYEPWPAAVRNVGDIYRGGRICKIERCKVGATYYMKRIKR